MIRRVWLGALAALALAPLPTAAGAAPEAFRVGIAPHSSARVIVQTYQPLRAFLEHFLERPVEIVTAADFTEFARRGLQQGFDLAVTTGHQARLFETDAGYLPLLTYRADFKAVILVAAHSPYRTPQALAGKTVIGLSPASLVTIWGQHWLLRNGVAGVQMRYVSASDSVARLLLGGEAAAGMTSLVNFQNLRPEVRDGLRVLDESLPLAGRVYVLNRRHAGLRARIDAALWASADTPDAKEYFARYELAGYRRLDPRELVAMEPYASEVRRLLKPGR